MNNYLVIHPEVKEALAANKAVVALESTIISHGMPYPKNIETALAVEEVVRQNGASISSKWRRLRLANILLPFARCISL